MSEAPEFVTLVRSIIPRDGVSLSGTKAGRIKTGVKKLLNKSGYETETIRGIGLRVGDYAVVYETTDNAIKASFQEFASLPVKTRKKRSSSKKVQPILTGVHPSTVDLTAKEFARAVFDSLPNDWQEVSAGSYRWVSTDMDFLRNTRHSVEDSVHYMKGLALELISKQPIIYRTFMEFDGHFLIGVGPA